MKYGIYKTITRIDDGDFVSDFVEYWHVWEYTVDSLPVACYQRQQHGETNDGVESLIPDKVQGSLTLVNSTFEEYITELRENSPEGETITSYQWAQPLATIEGSVEANILETASVSEVETYLSI